MHRNQVSQGIISRKKNNYPPTPKEVPAMKKIIRKIFYVPVQLLAILIAFTFWTNADISVDLNNKSLEITNASIKASDVFDTVCSGVNAYFGFFFDLMDNPTVAWLFGLDDMDDSSKQFASDMVQSCQDAVISLEEEIANDL